MTFLQMLHLIMVLAAVLCVFVARVAIPVIPELGQNIETLKEINSMTTD